MSEPILGSMPIQKLVLLKSSDFSTEALGRIPVFSGVVVDQDGTLVGGGGGSTALLTNVAVTGRGAAVVSPGTGVVLSAQLTGTGPASFRLEQSDDGLTGWESLGVVVNLDNSDGPISDGKVLAVSKKYLSAIVLTLPTGSTINSTVRG